MTLLQAAAVLAGYRYDDHMGGDWWWMALLMVLFWVTVAGLIVYLARSGFGHRPAESTVRPDTPEDTLRRRLAEGAISPDEYRAIAATLRDDSDDSS